MPAPTEILHLKCCICKTRIFLSDRRRNVCINYFIPPPHPPRKERFLEYTGIIYFMQEHWKFLLHKNNVMI